MHRQTKYKEEIIKELQDIQEKDMPELLEMIHYLKTGIKKGGKKLKSKREESLSGI